MKRTAMVVVGLVIVGSAVGLGTQLGKSGTTPQALNAPMSSKVFVGGDLHSLTVDGSQMVVTGHQSAAKSMDGGQNWTALKTLDGEDIMGWASNLGNTFAGGHNGFHMAPTNGDEFKRIDLPGGITDIHALGAAGEFVYLASPQAGFLASEDGGKTWILRNSKVGQGFMGSMLVDPIDPLKVFAPDMQSGLVSTIDGGLTWRKMGGPAGSMSVAWNPENRNQIAVVGMSGGALTSDGGATWSDLALPEGGSAIAFSKNGKTIYAATLDSEYATIYRSLDFGKTWTTSTGIVAKKQTSSGKSHDEKPGMDPNMPGMGHDEKPGMDPNMPGMGHEETAASDHSETAPAERPLKTVLGVFGLASTLVISSAFALRRKDRIEQTRKMAQRKSGGKTK
ncbi:MAG: hypothetical protein H7227_04875 [Actinobacteria bacterium]|nr:hypothetical protein [Actinomycetota bacterium]